VKEAINWMSLILAAILSGVLVGVVMLCVDRTYQLKEVRAEAVRRGYAEYVPNKDNEFEFKWKEKAEK
jgi:cell division protein FtsN